MTLDDFFFYLPGYASIFLLAAGFLATWIVWRAFASWRKSRKKSDPVEPSPKP